MRLIPRGRALALLLKNARHLRGSSAQPMRDIVMRSTPLANATFLVMALMLINVRQSSGGLLRLRLGVQMRRMPSVKSTNLVLALLSIYKSRISGMQWQLCLVDHTFFIKSEFFVLIFTLELGYSQRTSHLLNPVRYYFDIQQKLHLYIVLSIFKALQSHTHL